MFDMDVYRYEKSGGNPDKALLVSFYYEAKKDKTGEFVNIPFIKIWMDKNSEVTRPVSKEDKVRFEDRWNAFLKNEEIPEEGTPIKDIPFATPANVAACKSERITTAEQLAETPDERVVRAYLVNFKYQVKEYLKSLGDSNHVQRLSDENRKLKDQLRALEERVSNLGIEEPAKKRRGRPKKNVNATSDA